MSNLSLFGISVLITFALIIISFMLLFGLPLAHFVFMINGALVESVTGARQHSTAFSVWMSLLGLIEILCFSSFIYGFLYIFLGK